jgi:hypothetical protein
MTSIPDDEVTVRADGAEVELMMIFLCNGMRVRQFTSLRSLAISVCTAVLVVVSACSAPPERPAPPAQAAAGAPPTADVQAGSRLDPGTTWLANVKSCNRFVSKAGDDTTGMTEATAWRTVEKAMRQLQPGQTACIHKGTYDETPMAATATGSATDPIAIKAFPGEVPEVRAIQDGSLFDLQRQSGQDLGHWLLEGLKIDMQQRDGAAVRIEGDRTSAGDTTLVHDIVVRGNTIQNGKAGAAILVRNRVTDVLLHGNSISDNHRFEFWENYMMPGAKLKRVDYVDDGTPSTQTQPNGTILSYGRSDANGINAESDSTFTSGPSVERIRIEGNALHANGGDGFQCVGTADGDGTDHASDAADIALVDNIAEANAEEAADIKSCQWVSIRGSVSPADAGKSKAETANNIFSTSQPTNRSRDLQKSPTSGNFGGGDLLVVHWNARHVLVENTRMSNACSGIAVGRAEVPVRHLIIRRVLVAGMVSKADPRCAGDKETGMALTLDRVENADIYHNTFDMQTDASPTAVAVGTNLFVNDPSKGPFLANVDFWNNIVRAPHWLGLAITVKNPSPPPDGFPYTSNFTSDRNLYFSQGPAPPPNRAGFTLNLPPIFNFDPLPLMRTTKPPQPADSNWRDAVALDGSSIEADPLFDLATNDYFTQIGSQARNAALPIPNYGVPPCPNVAAPNPPDIGFRESCT